MAVIDYIDGTGRLVYLAAPAGSPTGALSFHPVDDVYVEYRALRRTVEEYRKYDPFMEAAGKVPKGGGRFTPRYLLLLNGTKLVIPSGVSEVNVTGEVLTDDQSSPFDTSLAGGPVIINYTPPEAEVIEVVVGGGGAPTAEQNAAAVWAHATGVDVAAKIAIVGKILRNKTLTDPSTGIMTVYDDDGVSVLFTAQMYEGTSAAQPYRGQGAERRERLS